jgi:hypothetical protein
MRNNIDKIQIYSFFDNQTHINAQFDGDTVWLSLNQISQLFDRDKSVISRHLNGCS